MANGVKYGAGLGMGSNQMSESEAIRILRFSELPIQAQRYVLIAAEALAALSPAEVDQPRLPR